MHDLVVGGGDRRRKRRQEIENLAAVLEIAACELSDDERVNEHDPLVENIREAGHPSSEMFHPDGRVNQDHETRRRGAVRRRGSLPARRARRRAFSRAISARSPSCTSSVRSRRPVTREPASGGVLKTPRPAPCGLERFVTESYEINNLNNGVNFPDFRNRLSI